VGTGAPGLQDLGVLLLRSLLLAVIWPSRPPDLTDLRPLLTNQQPQAQIYGFKVPDLLITGRGCQLGLLRTAIRDL
jgi:hypothetical protein